jgi:hypothetical protein
MARYAVGHLLQGERLVEDLAGVDRPLPDPDDEVGEKAPDRGGAAVQVHRGKEVLQTRDRHVVGHTDEADGPA